MKKITPAFIAFLLINLYAFCQTTSKIVLVKNTKFEILNTTTGTVSMEMMGQSMETKSEASDANSYEVKEALSSGYTLSETLTKVKLNVSGGMAPPINFDSEKKENLDSEVGKTFKDKLNKPSDVQIDLTGKKTEKKDESANEQEAMANTMQSIISAGVDKGIEAAFMVIPANKKAGDSWFDSSNNDGIRVVNTHTLTEMKGSNDVVVTKTIANAIKSINIQGAEIGLNVNSKVISTASVETASGLIKEKITIVDGAGTMDAGGQTIPMTFKTTTNTTVKSL